jgi:hypothetical protein
MKAGTNTDQCRKDLGQPLDWYEECQRCFEGKDIRGIIGRLAEG